MNWTIERFTSEPIQRRLQRGIIALLVLYSLYRSWNFVGYTDFQVYYDYGRKVLASHTEHPVSFELAVGETSPFRYAPFWGALFAPFALLPIHAARTIWTLLQWGVYLLTVRRVSEAFRLTAVHESVLYLGTLRFMLDNASIGQVSAILALLLVEAALRAYYRKGSAGVYLALAVSMKVQPLALLGIAFIRRRFRLVAVFLMAATAMFAASFVWGRQAFSVWLRLLAGADTVLPATTIGNQSLYGACLRLWGEGGPRIFLGLLAASALYFLWVWQRRSWNELWGWALGIGLLPVFGILTWKNTYLLLLFPLAFLIRRGFRATLIYCAILQLLSRGVIGDRPNAISLEWSVIAWLTLAYFVWMGAFAAKDGQDLNQNAYTEKPRVLNT